MQASTLHAGNVTDLFLQKEGIKMGGYEAI
jgi:hypothetical protein